MLQISPHVMKNNQYKYYGLKLTPFIFASILIYLYDGKRFKRQDAIHKVKQFHVEHGGSVARVDLISVFKKSSAYLRKRKCLTNIGYGVWELNYNKQEIKKNDRNPLKELSLKQNSDINSNINPQKVIGQGKENVYVYYYSTYRKFAEKDQLKIWPCKIGKTNTTAVERVFSQSGTAYPEYPTLSLVIKCDNSTALEQAIHTGIAKLKTRQGMNGISQMAMRLKIFLHF